jgi:hypothetical protein
MKVLVALCIASTLCLSVQSQVGRSRNSAKQILPLTQAQVAQLPLTTRPVAQLESAGLPPSVPYEFRGIRIGDQMKEAKQKFLSWKIPSLPFKPGLCGSDGIYRMETCTDVLETAQYVNMTILDQKVAQIYVSTDSRTEGHTYDGYVLMSAKRYGRPDTVAIGQNRSGLTNEFSGERLRWSKGEQYIKASRDEHAFTLGSESHDVEMDKLERTKQF